MRSLLNHRPGYDNFVPIQPKLHSLAMGQPKWPLPCSTRLANDPESICQTNRTDSMLAQQQTHFAYINYLNQQKMLLNNTATKVDNLFMSLGHFQEHWNNSSKYEESPCNQSKQNCVSITSEGLNQMAEARLAMWRSNPNWPQPPPPINELYLSSISDTLLFGQSNTSRDQ